MSDSSGNSLGPVGTIVATQTDAAEVAKPAPGAEAAAEVKKPDDFLAPKFAALTRKEKQLREMEKSFKTREAEIEKRMKEIEERSKSASSTSQSAAEALKANPLKFMRDNGLTLDQLVQMQLNDENPTMDMKFDRYKQELESKTTKEIEQLKQSLKEKEEKEAQARYDAAVENYKQEVQAFIGQNADTYELISANNAHNLVFEVAEQYFNDTQKVLDMKAAADAVEAHLYDEASKIMKLKKFQQTSQTPGAKPAAETAPTLSNTQASEVPKNGSQRLSDEESKREAAKLLRWNS